MTQIDGQVIIGGFDPEEEGSYIGQFKEVKITKAGTYDLIASLSE